MTAEKHESLAAALAAFQAALPSVTKNRAGQARGARTRYADLAEVSSEVLPLLGAHGLSFSARPTLLDDGRFVLAYALRHETGGEDTGMYPLPQNAGPQDLGSALTYARRYTLMAVTGVAPDDDDDGHAAQTAHDRQQQQRPAPVSNGRQKPAQRPATLAVPPVAKEALEELAAVCTAMGYDRDLVAALYAAEHDGANLRQATDAAQVRAFIEHLDSVDPTRIKAPVAASNGAAQ